VIGAGAVGRCGDQKEDAIMHTVRIHQFGDEGVLRHEEMPDPQPGLGQVRVAVKAASINRGDLARRAGTYPGEAAFPLVLGFEVAGDIDAVGEGVDKRRIGQRVVAMAASGGYADRFVALDAAAIVIPHNLDYGVAASIPVVFLTAWYGLVTTACVQPQEWVLVHAAASGVGMAGIQIAKHCGARVLTTASSAAKLEFGSRMGADAVLNYSEQDFVEAAWRITEGAGIDVVLESIGGEVFEESLDVLRVNGRLVCVGNTLGKTATVDPSALIRNNISIHGLYLVPWFTEGGAWRALHEIIQLAANGTFRVAIDRRFPLREAAAAHHYLEQRKCIGKVVLEP
jgi:NADPH2:quinone reductase